MKAVKVVTAPVNSQHKRPQSPLIGPERRAKLPIQFRRIKKKDPVESIEERLNHIQKALSILPAEEADALFLDIVSRKPEEIFRISQPYIDKSYSLKLIDSRTIVPEKNMPMPTLRIPFAVKHGSSPPTQGGEGQSKWRVTSQAPVGHQLGDTRSSSRGMSRSPYTQSEWRQSRQSAAADTKSSFGRTSTGFSQGNDTAEEKFKNYIDNFCELNEKMYSLNQAKLTKPLKIKERLPVRLSEKTQAKWRAIQRRELLSQLKTSATTVNLDLHKIMDADLYGSQGNVMLQDELAKIKQKEGGLSQTGISDQNANSTKHLSSQGQPYSPERLGGLKGRHEHGTGLHMSAPNLTLNSTAIAGMQDVKATNYTGPKSLKQKERALHDDDYLYDKNYGYYVHLNTDLNRNFKRNRDKFKTGVYLGRTPAAGEELNKIKTALKPFYTALPMSNLNIVKEFHRVYKEIGSKLKHKVRNVSPNRSQLSPALQSLAIGAGI